MVSDGSSSSFIRLADSGPISLSAAREVILRSWRASEWFEVKSTSPAFLSTSSSQPTSTTLTESGWLNERASQKAESPSDDCRAALVPLNRLPLPLPLPACLARSAQPKISHPESTRSHPIRNSGTPGFFNWKERGQLIRGADLAAGLDRAQPRPRKCRWPVCSPG